MEKRKVSLCSFILEKYNTVTFDKKEKDIPQRGDRSGTEWYDIAIHNGKNFLCIAKK